MSVEAVQVEGFYPGFLDSGLSNGSPTEPEAFPFGAQTGITLSTTDVTSNTVTMAGLTITANFSLAGDASAEYSQNGGAWLTAPSTCVDGDTFAVRLDASASYDTTVSCTLTVNGVDSIFFVTTEIDPALIPQSDSPFRRGRASFRRM